MQPRARQQVVFGLFAILWGSQVMLANLGRLLGDSRVFAFAYLASMGFQVATLLSLVHFASSFGRGRALPPLASAALAAVAAGVLAFRPDLLLAAVGRAGTTQGPLALPLVHAPFYAAFWAALPLLGAAARGTALPLERDRIRTVHLALALFTTYATVRLLLAYLGGLPGARVSGPLGFTPYLALFAFGTLALAAHVVDALARPWGPRRDLALAFGAPAAWAVAEGAYSLRAGFVDSIGLWRLATVGFIVYALARHRLFDLDLRIKTGVKGGTVAGAFVVVYFVATALAENYFSSEFGWAYGGVAAGLLTLLLHPLQAIAARVSNVAMPGVSGTKEYLAYRKIQVYRSTFEGAVADGELSPKERRTLDRLARELVLDPRDVAMIEDEVQEALRRTGEAAGRPSGRPVRPAA